MLKLSSAVSTGIVLRYQAARRIAFDAGAVLMQHLGQIQSYTMKSSSADLVTVADRASEALILAGLRAAFPDDPIVGEETDGQAGARARQGEVEAAEFAWCVDPLDGTTNYFHGYPSFAVSIGLLWRGQPAAGIVHAPARKETFAGGLGIPPTKNGVPIGISKTAELSRALVASGFPYDREAKADRLLAVLRRVLTNTHGFRRAGSASLDMCDLACGRLDGYYEWHLSPWDVAAGHAIVEAAGGRITNDQGAAHALFAGNTVATNGAIHDALLDLLRGSPDL